MKAISIHQFDDPVDAIQRADAIFISGGNSWRLNQLLHEYGLVVPIQRAVRERGVPYVGWSAGCNVATPASAPPTTCRCAAPPCCRRWACSPCRSIPTTWMPASAATWGDPGRAPRRVLRHQPERARGGPARGQPAADQRRHHRVLERSGARASRSSNTVKRPRSLWTPPRWPS